MNHYPSDTDTQENHRYLALGVVALLGVIAPLLTFASLITTDRYIVREGETLTEDQYVTAASGQIEGVVDGDVVIFSGSLTITGEVTGSVTVLTIGSVTVTEGARIGGSLIGTAGGLQIEGSVDKDVFVGSSTVAIGSTGVVGGDVYSFAGVLSLSGDVGRDVRGRMFRTQLSGAVGNDLDISTQKLKIMENATIGGDLLYHSNSIGEIDQSVAIAGTTTRLPTRGNFVYGVIFNLVAIIGAFGFVVTGISTLWILRSSGSGAVESILHRPIRSFLSGLFTVVVFPVVTLILALTLVGIPLALLALLAAGVVAIIGPVPAVTALGNRVLFGHGGLFGAFIIGAILWFITILLLPVVGWILYLLGLVWGVGAWMRGFSMVRESSVLSSSNQLHASYDAESILEGGDNDEVQWFVEVLQISENGEGLSSEAVEGRQGGDSPDESRPAEGDKTSGIQSREEIDKEGASGRREVRRPQPGSGSSVSRRLGDDERTPPDGGTVDATG